VPGSPLDPRAEGGNHLIREGATLCAEASHVIEALTPLLGDERGFGQATRGWRDGAGGLREQPLWDELDLPGIEPAPSAVASGLESVPELPSSSGEIVDLQQVVLELLGTAPVSVDDIVRASGRPAREISRTLLDLELDAAVRRHPGGEVSRVER